MNNGALLALVAKDTADSVLQSYKKKDYLTNNDYQSVYTKLKYELSKEKLNEYKYTFTINPQCDLLSNVDLYVSVEKDIYITDITQIETLCGNELFDVINGDIKTIINTTGELLNSKRKIEHLNTNKIIIPLHMAPFNNNLISPEILENQIKIIIHSKIELSLDLYAECYFFYANSYIRKDIQSNYNKYITHQHQIYNDINVIKPGINTYKLYFSHPLHCIYFWGFDKTKIKRIILRLGKPFDKSSNDMNYYDGNIEPLEYYKKSKGINADPLMILFSNLELNKSTINFNRLKNLNNDNPTLIIETEQEEETPLYLVGINAQVYETEYKKVRLLFK